MDPVLSQAALAAISAVGGGVITQTATWFFTRGDRKADRELLQSAANDKLASELREEQRKDNSTLRESIAHLGGQVTELNKTNESLRKENLALTEQNGKQAYQLVLQAGQLAQQAGQISAMQKALAGLQDHNAQLEAALKAADIPVPALPQSKPGTGPLVAA